MFLDSIMKIIILIILFLLNTINGYLINIDKHLINEPIDEQVNRVIIEHKMIFYKHELHEIFIKEKKIFIDMLINLKYQNIFTNIIKNVIEGKNELDFTILCYYKNDIPTILNNENIFNKINTYNISTNLFAQNIINKLTLTFPDSEIITWIIPNNINNIFKCILYKIKL